MTDIAINNIDEFLINLEITSDTGGVLFSSLPEPRCI